MREYSDPAKIIQEKIGNRFAIILVSVAASSGFTWKAVYDPAFIREIKPKEYIQHSEAIGASTAEKFEFETIKAGETTIAMRYEREWKHVPKDSKTFKISITES